MAKLSLNRLLETSKFLATNSGQELNDFIVYVSDLAAGTIGALRNGLTFADNVNCKITTLTMTSGLPQIVETDKKTPIGVMTMTGGSLEWVLGSDGKLTVTNWFSSLLVNDVAGSVKAFAGASAPSGWGICDGSAVSRSTYPALFTAIGTTYGSGDGATTFNLPDTREASIVGCGTRLSGVTAHDVYTPGVFRDDQMQGHTHTASIASRYVSVGFEDGNVAAETGSAMSSITSITVSSPVADGASGAPRYSNATHGKLIGMNHIICLGNAATAAQSKSVTLVILFN